tara:strand:- start:308 stop:481 length:174 start_codon:yes stop_codon:yes gene_type:complete
VIRLHMTLQHLDTLDDVLDLIPTLPEEQTRGIDMSIVKSLQEVVFDKQEDRRINENH